MIVETHDEPTRAPQQGGVSHNDLSVTLACARSHQEEIILLLQLISPNTQKAICAAGSA